MESKNLSTEDSKSENIAKKQKQDFSSQASALSKEPQNQKNTPPSSYDGDLPSNEKPMGATRSKKPVAGNPKWDLTEAAYDDPLLTCLETLTNPNIV